ncbi:hypothetical protein GCM10011393_34380 [Sphingopyxis bauzanensis]|nr:hypothetical protein GCM10011393_34380 [Sphingopyxis bauzanensis]
MSASCVTDRLPAIDLNKASSFRNQANLNGAISEMETAPFLQVRAARSPAGYRAAPQLNY